MTFLLLGTDACHLCELAKEQLEHCQLDVTWVDIAEHENWQSQYAMQIPVLLNTADARVLAWPFTTEDIEQFVYTIKKS